jgi:hypothetical protein
MGSFCENVHYKNKTHERHKPLRADNKELKTSGRRITSAVSSCADASMTVEAALAVPVFIFCMVNILMIFQMVEYNSRIFAAVHQTGNRIARTAGLKNATGSGTAGSAVLSLAYVPVGMSDCLSGSISENGCIRGGRGGLSYIGSSVLAADDIIDIHVSYHVRPAYAGYGWGGARMYVRYYGRGWTGYDPTRGQTEQQSDERMVFITKSGTVYHLSRGCRSLCPSVKGIPYSAVGESRNDDGRRYGRCPYCGSHIPGETVYVTDYGDCYHSSPCCRALRRTVYTIPLSQVGSRGPCAICGGGE